MAEEDPSGYPPALGVVVGRPEMASWMTKWRPWATPQKSKEYGVRLVVRRIEGLPEAGRSRAVVEVKWKGPLLRGGAKRNRTKEAEVREGGVAEWNEEFLTACYLIPRKDNSAFLPWEIAVTAFTGKGAKKKGSVIGVGSLNLAEFALTAEEKEMEINVALSPVHATSESRPTLHIALSLELTTARESMEIVPSSVVPVASSPPACGDLSSEKDKLSAPKAGTRRVNILRAFVVRRKSTKSSQTDNNEEKHSPRNNDKEHDDPCEINSLGHDHGDSSEIKPFSYGTLAFANSLGRLFYSDMKNKDDEDFVYYSHQNLRISYSYTEEHPSPVPEQPVFYTSKRSILPWKKNRLSFKSPKAKGEPLLKKSNGEEGGDDIDFDRRQLSSFVQPNHVGEFGDDNFVVGSWEWKEIVSRDCHLKLHTQAFFASIDQRSERASGGSACSVLVAVIADWFQTNPHIMPIKSQFDHLIREGSLNWRTLCENPTYKEQFPDGHFDIETVLEAEVRPLSIIPSKSFVGFFHPKESEIDDNDNFHFLNGAMSFDNIWDEITRVGFPCLYIISWNDHFFILKVEHDAYYIIDTLGERLHEGCNQAYILKFDDTSTIVKQKNESNSDSDNPPDAEIQVQPKNRTREDKFSGELKDGKPDSENEKLASEDEVICRGKECCKEYIKSFLAAIPIRELQVDIRKGLATPTLIHHRLQIEFHYTEVLKEQSTELQPTLAPVIKSPNSIESDSEFFCSTELDLEPSWTIEATAELQPTLARVIKSPNSTESDSEFLCSTELDLEPSWTIDATADFAWPVELVEELWPVGSPAPVETFFLTQPVNLEVQVV
ncbi:hypothetical protein Cni_G11817 [Canna indica]|uniref:C2 NT-type domain-containing protein n=1 Tax=Canna indica TaxID=4628 RepID=A0AAQ3K6Q1_9LILI|nr:hypothetical protein Cni_G11817 [Canna indica]